MNFSLIPTPTHVLDIGANVGQFYLEAKVAWPFAKFWLIDGNEECEAALSTVVKEKGDRSSIALLSNEVKNVDFYTLKDCATATGASYYRELTPFFADDKIIRTTRRTTTLDLEAAPWSRAEMLLIKIDCQGAELDILGGGIHTLSQADSVILELSEVAYNLGAPLKEEVTREMAARGFWPSVKLGEIVHPTERHVIQNDWLFRRSPS